MNELDKIKIVKDNIINQKVDCIINSTNAELEWEETTLNGDILNGAGQELIDLFKKLHNEHGNLNIGQCILTPGYKLPALHIIHALFPHWDSKYNDAKLLYVTLDNIFKIAVQNNFKTISIPPVATGVFAFPKEIAFSIIFYVSLQYARYFNIINFVANSTDDIKLFNKIFDIVENIGINQFYKECTSTFKLQD